MTKTDLEQVREHYSTLRDLVIRNTGGWDDVDARTKVEHLCRSAIAALDDAECQERLRLVQDHAADLFSRDGHLKWTRKSMSGADYLRLQILMALEALNTRLFYVKNTRRSRAA